MTKLWRGTNSLWICFCACLLCFSCKDSDNEGGFNPNEPVEVNQIVPETGKMSLPLVIHGKNFGTDRSKIKVLFDDVPAVIISAKNEHLYVLNPKQHGGEHTVKVVVEGKEGVLATKFNYIAVATVATVAGSGEEGFTDGELLKAQFTRPAYLSADDKNNIIVIDDNQKVRLVSLDDNKVTTLFNGGQLYGSCFSPDYSHMYVARGIRTQFGYDFDCNFNWENSSIDGGDFKVSAIAVVTDELGNIYFLGDGGEIIKKNARTNKFTKIGTIPNSLIGWSSFYAVYNPTDGMIYFSVKEKLQIIRVNVRKGGSAEEDVELSKNDYELYAGAEGEHFDYKDGYRLDAEFIFPMGIGVDSEGNLYIADNGNGAIRKIDTEGMVTTLAGGPDREGYKDGPLEDALFSYPCGLAVDAEDIIYVSEYNDSGWGQNNPRIRRIAIQ